MYERIIIASDLSVATNYVIECVQELKAMGTKEVILFHALGIRPWALREVAPLSLNINDPGSAHIFAWA